VSFQTLINRNLAAFLETGKFYEIKLIERSYALTTELCKKAASHAEFALLAGNIIDCLCWLPLPLLLLLTSPL
jgi:hypothetical protein